MQTANQNKRLCIIGNIRSVHVRRWASAMAGRGWGVTVLGPYRADAAEYRSIAWTSQHGGLFAQVRSWPLQLQELRRQLQPENFDLIWVHGTNQGVRLGLLPKSVPTVVTVYGSDVIPREGDEGSGFLRHLTSRLLTQASVVTAASDYLAEYVQKRFPKLQTRTVVVPFGVDLDLFRPLDELSDAPRPPRIMFAKSMKSIYGLDVLLEAAAMLKQRHVQFCLTVAGAGDAGSYVDRAQKLGLDTEIEFVGELSHPELARLLQSAAVFVMPTVVRESFGVAAVEAMACGVPVVASRIGAIPEVVEDAETGLLVAPSDELGLANAIEMLLANTQRRKAMGERGREVAVSKYDWRDCTSRMNEVLELASHRD